MVLHDLGGERNDLLRGKRAVRPDFHNQPIVVDTLPHAGALDVIVYLFDGGIDGIYGNITDDLVLVGACALVTSASADGHVHIEFCALVHRTDVLVFIDDLDFRVLLDVRARNDGGTLFADVQNFQIIFFRYRRFDGERL